MPISRFPGWANVYAPTFLKTQKFIIYSLSLPSKIDLTNLEAQSVIQSCGGQISKEDRWYKQRERWKDWTAGKE